MIFAILNSLLLCSCHRRYQTKLLFWPPKDKLNKAKALHRIEKKFLQFLMAYGPIKLIVYTKKTQSLSIFSLKLVDTILIFLLLSANMMSDLKYLSDCYSQHKLVQKCAFKTASFAIHLIFSNTSTILQQIKV